MLIAEMHVDESRRNETTRISVHPIPFQCFPTFAFLSPFSFSLYPTYLFIISSFSFFPASSMYSTTSLSNIDIWHIFLGHMYPPHCTWLIPSLPYLSGIFDSSILVMTSLVISCNLFPLRGISVLLPLLISLTFSITIHVSGGSFQACFT